MSSPLQLQHVKHAARRQGQHQAAEEELQDFRQWLDAAVQQLAAEQAQLAAEIAEDMQLARQQEFIAPPEEQTLEGVSWKFKLLRQTLLQCSALKSGCSWHKPFHHGAGGMMHSGSARYMSIMLMER